ncbi:MAG: glycoside hydrolase family protein, partial [Bacteroidales bacterium]|nr:glycoside hydrolase family protein [Bacteroidales bacterium]
MWKLFLLTDILCSMIFSSAGGQELGVTSQDKPFADRFGSVPLNSGFQMPGYNVWCGSVIKGEDGRYYMFASRWPEGKGYVWVLDSEVVLASSGNPAGPYQFEDVVLPKRGTRYWDGMMTHNPTIHKYKDTYLLYYTGTTYPERNYHVAWANKRIGLATATSVKGPWKRFDEPVLEPRPGRWDNQITSNPAPCIMPDGKVILVYKSTRTGHWKDGHFDFDLRLGVAVADSYAGPYKHVNEEPILTFSASENSNAEDAYIWYDKEGFHLLCKVFDAGKSLIGENDG